MVLTLKVSHRKLPAAESHLTSCAGVTSVESVMYNSTAQQWERLLEPGRDGQPALVRISLGMVNVTQVLENMEETPLITEGRFSGSFSYFSSVQSVFVLLTVVYCRCQHR